MEHEHGNGSEIFNSGERIEEQVAWERVLRLLGQDVREDKDGAENHREAEAVQGGVGAERRPIEQKHPEGH